MKFAAAQYSKLNPSLTTEVQEVAKSGTKQGC